MKHIKEKILITVFAILLIFCFSQCKTDNEELFHNITLYNQPLPIIKKYIHGKWKLQYSYGGLSAHKYIATNNSYMIINSDHLIKGNDEGVFLDTSIVWEREKDIYNETTYLMGYSLGGIYQIIDRIENDTLIIKEDCFDGYDYYYTKY
jgi:hypothetical protein